VTTIAASLPASLVKSRRDRQRAFADRFFRGLSMVAAIVAIVPLFAVIAFVLVNGIGALNLDLLTKPPKAAGIGGGAVASILGSLQLVGLGP
jgi:phosphate transport system permease protein